jgi:hypothetical protein
MHIQHPRLNAALAFSVSAASSAAATIKPQAMIVRSLPSRSRLALPISNGSPSS